MAEFIRPYLYPKQFDAIYAPERYSCIEASTKSGKAQPLDALIYTPKGPVQMENLSLGDLILNHEGTLSTVDGIFPQGPRQSYIITFNDGTEVECDGEHLWETWYYDKGPKILTTNELLKLPNYKLIRTNVPKISSAAFATCPVPLDPYLVGVLIGDGGLTQESAKFSSADPEVIDEITKVIPDGHIVRKLKGDNWDYVITVGNANAHNLRKAGKHISCALDELQLRGKLSHEKHIPKQYIYNNENIRWAILQGIMDTDGSVNQKGQPILEQTSLQLSKDIEELVQSLGGSVKTTYDNSAGYIAEGYNWVQGRRRYRQTIRLGVNNFKCFRLSRKLAKLILPKKPGNRLFNSIRLGRMVEMQCIKVSNPRQLYLTNGFIPTHNTHGCMIWLVEKALLAKPGQNFWWISPGYNQSDIAFRRIKQALTSGSFTSFEAPTPRVAVLSGAMIWFKSGDNPDALYGEDVFAAVIDEASRVKEESFYAVRSTLTATNGPLRIIGNVKGRGNWFYAICRKAQSGASNMHYAKITAIDAVAAGVTKAEEVEDARATLPDRVFRELYLAEPGDDGANPFGQSHIDICTRNSLAPGPAKCWGIDLAKKQDWFVCIGLNDAGEVCAFERWQHVPWRESILRVWALVGENSPAFVDSTGVGDPVLEQLQYGHGNFIGYNFTPTSKQKLMEGLAVAIQGHEIAFPDGPIRLELDMFEYSYTPTGVRYSAPDGHHDDCVCSLALAWQAYTRTVPGVNMIEYYALMANRPQDIDDDQDRLPWRQKPVAQIEGPLDAELRELYNEAVAQFDPLNAILLCHHCGKIITGSHRTTDGEFFWHNECTRFGFRNF